MSAEDHIAATQEALADFLRDRAAWRADLARQSPDDPRSARSAEALDELADWVMTLPASDERLHQLAALFPDESTFLAAEDAARFAGRYGYTFPATPDRFLRVFVALMVEQEAGQN